MVLATFLGLTGTAAAAEFESGIVFQDRQLIVVESGEAAQNRTVVLCNASDQIATAIHWSVGGFHFTDGEKAVGDDTVVSLSPTQAQLTPGNCESVTVTVAAEPEIDPGPFVGELVVTSAGAGVARVEISVAGPASPIVPTKGAAETIELTATRKLPFGSSSVSIDGDSALALKATPSGKSLEVPEEGAFIGNLVNAGDIASVYVTGEPVKHEEEGVWLLPIEVRGAAHTGVYEGVLTPTSSSSETQTVKAKVTITVWWIWAVAAVLLGTALVVGPTLWIRRYRVKGQLDDRRGSLVDRYAAAGKAFHQQFPKLAGIEAPEKADVTNYSAAVETAIDAYAESTWYFDTTSDAYAKLVKSLDTAEADLECLAGEGEAESLGKVLTDLQGTLDGLAAQLRKYLPIERQPTIALAAGAFLQPGRLAVGEATIRAQKAKEAREGIETWTELAQTLRRCEVWCRALEGILAPKEGRNFSADDFASLQSIYATIGEARNELLEAADAKAIDRLKVRKHLERVYRRLAFLGAKYKLWVVSLPPVQGSGESWPQLKLETADGLTDIPDPVRAGIAAIQDQLPSSIGDSASWRENADLLTVTAAQPVELGRTKRFIGDAMVVLLSLATGAVASLSAFYFGKTFGTVEDFLTVIFVGTASQAFLKPVTDTLAQLRGSTEPVTKSDPEPAAATTVAAAVSQSGSSS